MHVLKLRCSFAIFYDLLNMFVRATKSEYIWCKLFNTDQTGIKNCKHRLGMG